MLKNQLGSMEYSRRASLNNESIMSEHYFDSLNLHSFREEKKDVLEPKEETKIVNFSEPHRFIQSNSDFNDNQGSNSAISLRISVLSNKSEDIDLNNKNFDFSKLQRTTNLSKISALMPTEMRVDRKNLSETFYVEGLFHKLLEETDSGKFKNSKEINYNKEFEQIEENKIFEYKPQSELIQPQEDESKEHTPEEIGDEKKIEKEDANNQNLIESLNKVKDEEYHRQTPSEELFIGNIDYLNIEDLLGGDNMESDDNSFVKGEDKFSGQISSDFLHDLNKEIDQEDIKLKN